MRFGLTMLFVALVAVGVGQAAEPPAIETTVNAAIADFEPLWSPTTKSLRGQVIGIDPGGTGGTDPGERLRDDLSLLTAAHLYHFVIAAGGSPVLTRADDSQTLEAEEAAWQRRIALLQRAGCDVCVSIRYGESGTAAVVYQSGEGPRRDDAALARALGAACGVEPSDTGPADTGFIVALRRAEDCGGIPAGVVTFECPPGERQAGPALRKTCLHNARRVFEGISQFCGKRGAGSADAAEPSPVPDYPSARAKDALAHRARAIWPEGPLPSERLDWFCRRFARESITNHSLVYFEVSAERDQETTVLRGRTNAPCVVTGLERALQGVGVEQVRNEVRTLPDAERLGAHLYGVCRAPMALTYREPGYTGGLQTQLLYGEPLFLLDRADDFYLLHAGDGYWGWVPCAAVEPMTAEQFGAYMSQPRGIVSADIESERGRIPRSACVRVVRTDADERVILLADGTTLNVPAAAVSMQDPDGQEAAARVRAGLDLIYAPYVFGARSHMGLDCSGLAGSVQAAAGHRVARDAWQQALAGQLVATRWNRANIQPGDQLFFINEHGKIYHTGIALDAEHVVHSAPPCVQISSFDPQDPLLELRLERDFFMAKRP